MKRTLLLAFLMLGFTIVKSQCQCITVNSAYFTNPSGDNYTFNLNINWTAYGTSHLNAYVLQGTDTIYTTCLQVSGSGSGSSIYNGILSPSGLAGISAVFTRWTGPCGHGSKCGPDQYIPPGGVLDIKFEWIRAKPIGSTSTEIMFKAASGSTEKAITLNLRMKSGVVKKYQVALPREIKAGETWLITINHTTGKSSIVKF